MSTAAIAYSETLKTGEILRIVNAEVEDLRNHGEAVVARLRGVLAAGAQFTRDRKRRRVYEVLAGKEHFYIHVLRGAKKVLLLARWSD